MDAIYTEERNGFTIEIHPDDCAYGDSPREWSNVARLYTWQDRYVSPDPAPFDLNTLWNVDAIRALLEEYEGKIVFFAPISAYEHGQIVYRLGSPRQFPDWRFDAGYVGCAVIYRDTFEKEYGKKWRGTEKQVAWCKAIAESEIDVYSRWANGEVYSWSVLDADGNALESCGGYIEDYDGYPLEQARETADFLAAEQKKLETVKQWKAALATVAGI